MSVSLTFRAKCLSGLRGDSASALSHDVSYSAACSLVCSYHRIFFCAPMKHVQSGSVRFRDPKSHTLRITINPNALCNYSDPKSCTLRQASFGSQLTRKAQFEVSDVYRAASWRATMIRMWKQSMCPIVCTYKCIAVLLSTISAVHICLVTHSICLLSTPNMCIVTYIEGLLNYREQRHRYLGRLLLLHYIRPSRPTWHALLCLHT
jgi:hypothetical protein